jgi:4,5-DOPA dioxygenase extradiol
MGSGNIIHNLGLMNPSLADQGNPWAEKLKNEINQALLKRDDEALIHYEKFGPDIHKAFRTTEHYYPLLAVLGASEGERDVELFNDHCVFGSLSMTSVIIGKNALSFTTFSK